MVAQSPPVEGGDPHSKRMYERNVQLQKHYGAQQMPLT